MLSFEPNVIVIDDQLREVQGIINYYQEQGIGCKYYNPHLIDGHEKPKKCFSDVNLIFLDIYFTTNFHDYNPEFCSEWIESIIHEKTFYILIIWTTDIDKGEEVLRFINEKNRSPFCYFVKGKKQYETPEGYDFSQLQIDIEKELNKTPVLSEIGIWKKNIKTTANRVIGGLTKDHNPDIFEMKLQKIIVGHGGTSIITNRDNERKRSVLFDALDKVLVSNTSENGIKEPITEIISDQLYQITPNKLRGEIDAELNSWFHLKLEKDISHNCILPGLISKFNNDFLRRKFSIRDDSKIAPKLTKQSDENGVEIVDIVVVLSRPCDIAQNKHGKNIKLLSGLKIKNPKRYTVDILTHHQRKNKRQYLNKIILTADLPDSVKLYDHLYFSEEESDIALVFDFRYVFSVPEQVFKNKFHNLKIFNKELLSEIQVEYSSYASRLGFTQII